MQRFLLRRLIYAIFALVGVSILVFALSRELGDPRQIYLAAQQGAGGYGVTPELWEKLGKELHLDKPVHIQYAYWIWDVLRGNLGKDLTDGRRVSRKIVETFPATLKLALAAWILATIVGVPLGVVSAVLRGTAGDYASRIFALLGQALPAFWVGLMAMLVFSVQLRWLPTSTQGEGFAIRNYILPTLTLGWLPAAGYLRLTRSAMLEVMDLEYIKLARAKGVSGWTVIWKHAFRNALIPPLTISGLLLAGFMTGAIVIEQVFAWPGMGRLAVEAVWNNNLPVLTAVTLVYSAIFVVMNFLVDVAYAYVDPRIRYT